MYIIFVSLSSVELHSTEKLIALVSHSNQIVLLDRGIFQKKEEKEAVKFQHNTL